MFCAGARNVWHVRESARTELIKPYVVAFADGINRTGRVCRLIASSLSFSISVSL